jgi:hypothetical protein
MTNTTHSSVHPVERFLAEIAAGQLAEMEPARDR